MPALSGCISEGDTREKTLENIREAIALYLDPIEDDGVSSDVARQVGIVV